MALDERVHEQVSRQERLLQGILANSVDGIVLIDQYAQIQAWSPGQERITGVTQAEAAGEPLFDVLFRLLPANQRTIDAYVLLKERIAGYLRTDNGSVPAQAVESEIVRPDGRRRALETLYFPVAQNGEMRVACITRDVSERRMLERAELEMIRVREQFVASVSQGLRAPLRKLLGSLGNMQSERGQLTERQSLAVDEALAAGSQISELVNGLVEASRFESGVDLAMEQVDLRRIIQQALESVKQQAAEKGIPVAYSPDDDPPTVRANGPRLLQAVLSLIRNAIRMSETGSPVIVTAIARNGEVTVQVTDQGPGIPSAAEPQVFAKRAPGLLPGEDGEDSGELELYLSRKIIEAHGGQMGVRSQLGVGSTLYFSLPVVSDSLN